MTAQVEAAQKLYAALAQSYDDETRFITGIRKQAIDALNLRPGETVVDSGCGTGWCLPMLAEKVGTSGHVIGFEPSPDMLAIAQARVTQRKLGNTRLLHACGNTVDLGATPDAILFSYTHDLIRSRDALKHVLSQARPGTRIVAASTKLFPAWFFVGNWYLRYTHRVTITNFEGFERPWTLLAEFCSHHQVRITVPGSRYLFTGILD
ncbi:MAG: methyltransferase domain-containing protein [Betaproteobacteria bacterium]|nr:methyltransferase domain-containing protein [Betaproteobacteria bacterium]